MSNMEKEIELKPCAHCGSNSIFDSSKGMGTPHKRVSCFNCGSQSSSLEVWNRRSGSAPSEKEVTGGYELMECILSVSNQDLKEGMRRALQEMISLNSQISQLTQERDEALKNLKRSEGRELKMAERYDLISNKSLQLESQVSLMRNALEWLYWKVHNEDIQAVRGVDEYMVNVKSVEATIHKSKSFMNASQYKGKTILEAIQSAMSETKEGK